MLQLWVGRKVRLRAIQPDDVQHLAKYADDSEIDRLAGDTTFPYNPERDRRALDKEQDADADHGHGDDAYLVIETRDGKFVGTIQLYHTDRRHRTAEIGLVLNRRKAWGHGYGSEAMRLLLRFAFRELGYEKLGLSVYEFNTRALALYQRLGFQIEARRRSAIFTDGRRWDEIYLGLLRAEYDALHATWFPDATSDER